MHWKHCFDSPSSLNLLGMLLGKLESVIPILCSNDVVWQSPACDNFVPYKKKKLTEKTVTNAWAKHWAKHHLCSLMQKLSALRAVHIYRDKFLGTSVL